MKYMLVNVGPGSVQIDLHHPKPSYNKKNLHRPGPVVAINLPRGQSKDILPFFGGSLEEAHKCVKYSKDTIRSLRPDLVHAYVCGDDMKPLDVNALLSGKEEEVVSETLDMTNTEPTTDDGDDLTALSGVGPSSRNKLNEAGYKSFADVANADSESLKELLGVNAKKAQDSALELLSSINESNEPTQENVDSENKEQHSEELNENKEESEESNETEEEESTEE